MADRKPHAVADLFSVSEFESAARRLLSEGQFQVLFGTAGDDEWRANNNNVAAFKRCYLRPRVLRDVSEVDPTVTVLGTDISLPVIVGPAGLHQRFHRDGEMATSAGASAAGTIFTLATGASFSIEEVAAKANGPLWFQLYMLKDRGLTSSLVERAEAAGYRALVLTVDNPGVRSKERDRRFGYSAYGAEQDTPLEPQRVLRNLAGVGELPGNLNDWFDSAAGWSTLEWLATVTKLPIVVKGIQTREDARLCVEHGAAGVVVSNHGGHALWDARATLEVLPEVVEAAGHDLEVLVDGGIRRGTDVLKCLALGARAVLAVRAPLWGLALGGGDGVARILQILEEEIRMAMAYCGVSNLRSLESGLADWSPGAQG